jgi:RNA polymerase sigma factor (sigma-70 family)
MGRDESRRRRARAEWCAKLDAMFRAGEHKRLIGALMPEIRAAAVRVRGLTPEQRDDVISETALYLLDEWSRGKAYGGAPIVAVARRRTRYIALDLFQILDEPRKHGFKVVPLDYSFPTHDGEGDGDGPGLEAPDPGPGPEDTYLELETIEGVLAMLPPRERDVFRLRCFEGLGSYEVAEQLDCEPNAVDQAYHRAKRRLREDGLDF